MRASEFLKEDFSDDLGNIYALHPGAEESEKISFRIIDMDEDEFSEAWNQLPAPYQQEFGYDLPLWELEYLKEYPHMTVKRVTFDQYVKLITDYIRSEELSDTALNKMKQGATEGSLNEFAPTPDFGDGGRDDGEYMLLSEYADIVEQYLGRGYTREDRQGGAKHLPQISVKFVPKDKSQNGAILYSFIHPKRGEYGTHNTIILKYDEQGVGHGKKGPSAVPKTQKQALKIAQLIADQTLNESTYTEHEKQLKHFVQWCKEKLNITKPLPRMIFADKKEGPDQHRTGYYDDDTNTMWVYTGNRNLIDIMRTVCHELVHRKQHEHREAKPGESYPFSPIEQEADAVAGGMIKLYVKEYPESIE